MRLTLKRARKGRSGAHAQEQLRLPDASAALELVMPGGQKLPARVARRVGDELLVLSMVPLEHPPGTTEANSVVLELLTPNGVTRIEGAAVLEDRDLLRVRELRSLGVTQRRDDVRVRVSCPIVLQRHGGAAPIESSSIDLSGGGMLVKGIEHLDVGERLEFRLRPEADGPEITGSATVVRSDAAGRRAIAVNSISEGDHRRLVRFLFDCQREEMRRGGVRGDERER